MYLIDTSVITETRKGKQANSGVIRFWRVVNPDLVYVSVITIGELRLGVDRLRKRGALDEANKLERWLTLLMTQYGHKVLDFDADCAQLWGRLMARHNNRMIDNQIAATALLYGLQVVTQHPSNFEGTGVKLINPFT